MCPVSYSRTSSSDSATTKPGSSRCPATHSVVTIISGWAYSCNLAAESLGSATVSLISAWLGPHHPTGSYNARRGRRLPLQACAGTEGPGPYASEMHHVQNPVQTGL